MRIVFLVLTAWAAGCATTPRVSPAPPAPPARPAGASVVWLNVPLIPDRTNQCGPAAMAGVLRFWGKNVSMESLKREIYQDKLKGSLSIDMMLAAQAHGMKARLLEGGLAQAEKELDAGHPLIAYVNQGLRLLPVGHYVVLTGYDRARGGVYVNSDTRKNAFMSEASFDRQWARGDRWAMAMQPAAQ